MLNRCEFIGRVGKSPEVRYTNNGDKVVHLSLGVSEKWKTQSGEKKEKTEWVRIIVWDDRIANTIERYVNKGDLVRLVGKMETRKWTDNNGVDKYTTEIVLQKYRGELTLLDGRKGGGGEQGLQDAPDWNSNNSAGAGNDFNDLGDEIPFIHKWSKF